MPRTLAELFDDFKQEAFRLETLDDYDRSGNKDAHQLFLDGKPKPQGYNTGWPDEVRENVDAGRRMYRVHVATRPPREQPNPLADVGDFDEMRMLIGGIRDGFLREQETA